jgi:hypothetical protein
MDRKVLATADIFPPDEQGGWRVVSNYPISPSGSREYQSAHAQAFSIRSGRRAYCRKSGYKFDARVTKGDHSLILWVRCTGKDGTRWDG